MATPEPSAAPQGRLAAIDVMRGLALCGMIAFHADWDLAYGGWIDRSPDASPPWRLFGHAVAATFLGLAGYGLVLARAGGLPAALARIGRIGAAALLVTGVTGWLLPQEVIRFGILHCIALSSLLALPLRRASPMTVFALAAICGLAPAVWSNPGFDGPLWSWLGLGSSPPSTLDYRPLLPWLGVVLFGLAVALSPLPKPRWPARGKPGKALALLGRHSLVIYLLHQPVLFGLVTLAGLAPSAPAGRVDPVERQCEVRCVAAGAGAAGCASACRCVLSRLDGRGTTLLPDAAAACLPSATSAPSISRPSFSGSP